MNLEKLESRGNEVFYEKSGKTWNSQEIFFDIHPSQRKWGKMVNSHGSMISCV